MHDRDWDLSLERGLERFAELVGEDGALEREFVQSQPLFTSGLEGARRALAERRHLEWFVCERPSERLEGPPVDVLREAWRTRAARAGEARGEADEVLLDAMLGSLASAFEVAAVADEGALLVRDVLGLGEYELDPSVPEDLEPGDLVVGRIYPRAGRPHRLSPVASAFRDHDLIHALREDVERLRGGRGRVLRMQQSELETLFFRGAWAAGAGAPDTGGEERAADPAQAAELARAALASAGLDRRQAEAVASTVVQLARQDEPSGTGVTEILNTLAFETEVDLELARRALVELWSALALSPRAPASELATGGGESQALEQRTAEALRRFDEGRARGQDLDQLFAELERDLGVAGGEDDEAGLSPDFPGVVGAMVEEYLWDRERERGPAGGEERALLRELSRYAADIGVFEDLGARELVDFGARWLLDESDVGDEARARALLASLADFCRWSEERHAHPLWSGFEDQWRALREAVPRLVPLRPALSVARPDPGAYRVARIEPGRALLEDEGGRERELALDPGFLERLRPGDLLRLASGPREPVVCRVYPGVVEELRGAGDGG